MSAKKPRKRDGYKPVPEEPRPQHRDVIGKCPRCAEKGEESNLILLVGVSKKTGTPFEFAACEKHRNDCGYTASTLMGIIIPPFICPSCQRQARALIKKDGSRYFRCTACDAWYLADAKFYPVVAPNCYKCSKPMIHRPSVKNPARYYWACFGCKAYFGSDKFGKISTKDKADAPSVV